MVRAAKVKQAAAEQRFKEANSKVYPKVDCKAENNQMGLTVQQIVTLWERILFFKKPRN